MKTGHRLRQTIEDWLPRRIRRERGLGRHDGYFADDPWLRLSAFIEGGTDLPCCRCSLRPIAMVCLRFPTTGPVDEPECNWPRLNSPMTPCIDLGTLLLRSINRKSARIALASLDERH